MNNLKLIFVSLLLLISCKIFPQRNDSIQFSLLTCEPGTEIYSLFGHTAIRYQNFTSNTDIVFNYGMFSFSTPNFIYRFVKGETDYQLGINRFSSFEAEYGLRGSSVHQQVLNLTTDEKYRLQDLLFTNYRPENRVYRYNYFYDNCTTRARDQIEKCISGKVVYPEAEQGKSFRSIVHEFTQGFGWEQLGIDLCLGAEADNEIDLRQQMFSPFYMHDYASKAYIISNDGNRRPLVLKEELVVDAEKEQAEPAFPLSPMACSIIFLVLNLIVGIVQYFKKVIYWGWDIVLYLSQGIAGCIIAFLFFVSTHPTVGSNWLLILFNPIPLLYLPFMVYRNIKRKKDLYHQINFYVLTFFIALIPFIPQEINLSVLPLALGLLVNAKSHQLVIKNRT